ncbi:threonine synthase [Pseudofulvimonas gallinarii]|uniref:Threonine synthase n=1 Tax=Pseudofulvimonas gallinarii TaxID=634155 RepID=A0A4R3LED7_9GAMM|nr:threonine synthase [Pseudofulvimonas gallinarii]TCS97748.1 L-threonine synthase [Pseudofulvimonas gallinarii]
MAVSYVSTRGGSPAVGLSAAIAAGLAADGGLYVPAHFLRAPLDALAGAGDLADTASALLSPFFSGDPLAADLPAIARAALDFPVPLRALRGDDSAWLLELFHGPTAAFKDVGARFLAEVLARLPDAAPLRTVLVATSGDTGAAVAAAFHRRPGFRVVILYPDGRVSPRQAHQLGAFGDNVLALRVQGSFDDCQALVKQAFSDVGLRARAPLLSANSISLGRFLPQMGYYTLAAFAQQRAGGPPLNFIVPTGNLGNACAALMAKSMGVPIGTVALACNANRTLPDFLAGADYTPRASVATLANAMDVGAPSNIERLRWLYPDAVALRAAVPAASFDDAQIRGQIVRAEREHGVAVCPHTACGLAMLARLRERGDTRPWAIAATAHPAKFDSIVEPLLQRAVPVPPALASLLERPAQADPLAADYPPLRRMLLHPGRELTERFG